MALHIRQDNVREGFSAIWLKALLVGVLLLIVPSVGHSEVIASAVNGFQTSAPLEGFVKVTLENRGTQPDQATIELPLDCVKLPLELPPHSRKEVPVMPIGKGELFVRSAGQNILSVQTENSDKDATVLVISPVDNGLKSLARDRLPLSPQVQGGSPASPPNGGSVRVLRTAPGDLPPSWQGYPLDQLTLVVHPGGFDAMTANQREALRVVSHYFANVALVSEGRPDAFNGTPVEDLLPGEPQNVKSYSDWPDQYPGSARAPSAVAVLKPKEHATVETWGRDSTPLVLSVPTAGDKSVHFIAFDFNAQPLRSANLKDWWYNQIIKPDANSGDSVCDEFTGRLFDMELSRLKQTPPPQSLLGLVAMVLLLGYIAAIYTGVKVRKSSPTLESWLVGTVWMAGVFAFAVCVKLLQYSEQGTVFEISVSRNLDDQTLLREGLAGLNGPGVLNTLSPKSRNCVINAYSPNRKLGQRSDLWIEPHTPPIVHEYRLNVRDVLAFHVADIAPIAGPATFKWNTNPITQKNTSTTPTCEIHYSNHSGMALHDVLVFGGFQYAEIGDIAPGEVRDVTAQFTSPQVTQMFGNQLVRKAPTKRELLIKTGVITGSTSPPTNKRFGFAVARVDLPSILPGMKSDERYYIIPMDLP